MTREVPNAFVWTKIQAEGGQGVEKILNRKHSECQSGGTFWWGIGESKADQIGLILERNTVPVVLFSQMRSPAHRRDSHPGTVVIWRAYETENGDVPIPPHVVVTSRAHDRKGREKQHHYALVCKDLTRVSSGTMLDSGKLRNFGKDGKKVERRQVTAAVKLTIGNSKGLLYPITARGMLVAPYVVKLKGPIKMSAHERQLLDGASDYMIAVGEWMAVANELRGRNNNAPTSPAPAQRSRSVTSKPRGTKMGSNIGQNRLVIVLARRCLEDNGFRIVERRGDQGTFPHTYTIAEFGSARYLIGITGREEVGAEGELNPNYNLVRTAGDLQRTQTLADDRKAVPAFVAVALCCNEGRYSAYFDTLAQISFRRQIPMLLEDRNRYRQLAGSTIDERVAALCE